MNMSSDRPLPGLGLSHLELYVRALAPMEDFYTRCLGFVVTDRGEGAGGLVFLSQDPDEHHQLVLNPQPSRHETDGPLDHVSFRVRSLVAVRAINAALGAAGTAVDAVSHGSTWSIYFRDPDGNRIEVFADTPWYVHQPCRFSIDLGLDDEALHDYTLKRIRGMAGFRSVESWQASHRATIQRDGPG